MAHLSCKKHKRRVLVVDDLKHEGQWVVLHRSGGTECRSKVLVSGSKEYDTEIVRIEGLVPDGKPKGDRSFDGSRV